MRRDEIAEFAEWCGNNQDFILESYIDYNKN